MLSNKWTFSLVSLVVLLAFGLAFFAPSDALGHKTELHPVKFEGTAHQVWWDGHPHPEVTVTAIDIDPSAGPPAIQLVSEHESDRQIQTGSPSGSNNVDLKFRISFSKAVNLDNDSDVTPSTITERSASSPAVASDFHILDVFIALYDKDFAPLGFVEWIATDEEKLSHASPGRLGQDFDLEVPTERIIRAGQAGQSLGETYVLPSLRTGTADGDMDADRVRYLTVSVRDASVRNADQADVFAAITDPIKVLQYNILNAAQFELVRSDQGDPRVLKMERRVSRSDFTPAAAAGSFDVEILLSEEPAAFGASHLAVTNGKVLSIVKGVRQGIDELSTVMIKDAYHDTAGGLAELRILRAADFTGRGFLPFNAAGTAAITDAVILARRSAAKVISYLATIEPDFKGDVIIKVADFDGRDSVSPNVDRYMMPTDVDLVEGVHKLTVKVGSDKSADAKVAAATTAYELRLKDNVGIFNLNPNLKVIGEGTVIPAGGYLVLASGKTDSTPISGVVNTDSKKALKLTAAQKLYNVVYEFKLPFPADDLSNFFRNGGALQVIHSDIPAATASGHDKSKASQDGVTTHADYTGYVGATTQQYAAGSVIISEIMWGLDTDSTNAQYIELHNTTAADIGIDHLEWAIAVGSGAALGGTVTDTVNNNPPPVAPATSGYWVVPGNSGVSAASATHPTVIDLISMSRVMGGTDGTAAMSWAASILPSANMIGRRIGTPGAANIYVMPAPMLTTPTTPVVPAAPVAKAGDIMISEIMVASNDGRLPQWIEIANGSAAAVSLSGWSLEIENDSADADVVGASIELDLGDVEIGAGEVALVISKEGRNSGVDTAGVARVKGDANAGNLDADRIIDVKSQVSPTNARYSLISEMGFMLSLIPPQTGAVRTPGDVVGNLGGGWELPMSEDGRSSLIRREMDNAAMATMGTDAAGWVLASDTMLSGAYRATYYGSDEDVGTPGFDAGGALPVELSGFNAARDKVTGAVVITWATQSELNNAGFFIKRSQQQKGKFVVVNPTMIAGAGTTAEKQSYTYTDATADPNVIYYYQIEDVSLDGNRQTLTRAHRLKGHIGAAGKVTTTWGDLKSSRD